MGKRKAKTPCAASMGCLCAGHANGALNTEQDTMAKRNARRTEIVMLDDSILDGESMVHDFSQCGVAKTRQSGVFLTCTPRMTAYAH